MNLIASKTSILEEILKIDDEIKQIKTDSTYLKIKRNLQNLESISFGNPIINTQCPDNLDKKLRIRRHSKEMKDIIQRYRDRQLEFEDKMNKLYSRKKTLEEQIFC